MRIPVGAEIDTLSGCGINSARCFTIEDTPVLHSRGLIRPTHQIVSDNEE